MKMKNDRFLPEDILENILSRLPAKTVVKFKIVSKKWESLISSCYFKRLHDEKSLKNFNLMLLSNPYKENKPVLITVGLSGDILDRWNLFHVGINGPCTMLSSPSGSNDLICLVDNKKRYVVCDPNTKQAICLPKPKAEISAAGFGYLPNNQYVIVSRIARKDWQMITFSRNRNGFSVGGWKTIEDCELYHLDGLRWGVYANGVLYWMRLKVSHVQLVCFDLCKEKFSIISMPEKMKDGKISEQLDSSLLELGGDLHVMFGRRSSEWIIELWKLDDARNGRWTKRYICKRSAFFWPLLVNVDGEMLVYNGEFLEWYSLQDGVLESKRERKRIRDIITRYDKFGPNGFISLCQISYW